MKYLSSNENKVNEARDVVIKGITPSLLPLIFRDLDKKGQPPLSAFKVHVLPRTAALICKFSGLLLQAYWYLLNIKKRDSEIPSQLNDILLQVWAGHQRYSEGLAVSLLHEASLAANSSSISKLVKDAEVFVGWSELLLHREGRYKELLHEFSRIDRYQCFERLIEALPILRSTNFDGNQFEFPGKGVIPKFPFVYDSLQCRNPLYLYTFDHIHSHPVVIFEDSYSDYTEELILNDSPSLEEQYYLMREVLGFKDVRQGMLYLFGSGYHHIKNLALAIADTPGSSLDEFVEYYKKNNADISPDASVVDFITLALANSGPTEVLKQLFRKNQYLIDDYLKHFERRGLGRESDWKQIFNEQIHKKRKNIEALLELDNELKEQVEERIELETRCWCVMRAAGLKIDTPHDYVESMGVRLRMLENFTMRYRNSQYDVLTVGIKIAKLVERTFRFLICFYSGVVGYHRAYENRSSDYHKCEESMLTEAVKAYKRIATASPGSLVAEFRELCSRLSSKGAIDDLLGRREVCDLHKFNKKFATTEWIGIFNRLKHDKAKGEPSEVTADEIIDFIDRTYNLFNFFRDGRELSKVRAIFEGVPIYPIVVSFREQHRKRDGLIIYNYKIHALDGTETGQGVKILTPHEYIPNEDYYCIPFYKRSTKDWLLDPFLIRCSRFNAVMNEEVS